ncbi:putative ARF GTPase-activating protein GIT2 [Hypsibius exemplaris]|uniref:ARF GTPase-activating protein GIT2 n=1 Tax=Hypsibius exemplaris TaxID=2072580 RepID=A0A9X6NC07_HYPEX|nr:putative ARF GTPase-activating protein GIT2 [Hypsibius exemplaris]
MADRLMECQYELTDRLAYFLCQRKPDHAVGQHFIIPELTMERSQTSTKLAKSARRNVQALNNALFESLAMDVYDEVDRQETDNNPEDDREPLYDAVAVEDDYVDAKDDGVFWRVTTRKWPLDQPCPACDSVVTAAQYFEMKRALEGGCGARGEGTSTVYAMKDDLNRLFTQVGTLLHPTSSHPPSTGALSPSTARQAQIESVEPVFAKSIRDDSGIQEGQDEPQSGSNGYIAIDRLMIE